MDSNSPISYLLDKYLFRTHIHIRACIRIRVSTYFANIYGYPEVLACIYKRKI